MRTPLVGLAVLALSLPAFALAQSEPTNPTPTTSAHTCDGQPERVHRRAAKRVIRRAFRHKAGGPRYGKHRRQLVKRHRGCLTQRKDRRDISQYERRKRRSYRRWERRHDTCAPPALVHPQGGGCWVIPESVVMCESGGSFTVINSIGAGGAYQIIPSTWRANGGLKWAGNAGNAPPQGQHIVAHRILVRAGPSQWDCW